MEKYIKLLQERGAIARKISAESIITAPWTVLKCQFGCANYGKNLCCPPFTPTFEQMRRIIQSYTDIILFTSPDKRNITHIAVDVAREMFFDGFYKALPFGSGQCNICEKCSLTDGCRFPGKAAPSMEACGIDVFATARNNNFTINTLRSRDEQNHNFGLILVD